MMRVLKWLAITVVVLAAVGFLAFLYFIPPFFSVTSEDYVKQAAAPAVSLETITDPAQRAIAERGKYIVMISGCADCHSTPGPAGAESRHVSGGRVQDRRKGGGRRRQPQPDSRPGDGPRQGRRRRGETRASKRGVPRRPAGQSSPDALERVLQLDRGGSARGRHLPAADQAGQAQDSRPDARRHARGS